MSSRSRFCTEEDEVMEDIRTLEGSTGEVLSMKSTTPPSVPSDWLAGTATRGEEGGRGGEGREGGDAIVGSQRFN